MTTIDNQAKSPLPSWHMLIYLIMIGFTFISMPKNEMTFLVSRAIQAIELAIQLRAQTSLYKDLGTSEKESFFHNSGDAIFYRVALYEPNDYREKAIELEKLAHRLSNAINAKNYQVQINFDDSKYF